MGNDKILKNKVDRRKKYNKRQKLDAKILKTLPHDIQKDTSLLKYWYNRFRLFKKFDQGIKLDKGKTNKNKRTVYSLFVNKYKLYEF